MEVLSKNDLPLGVPILDSSVTFSTMRREVYMVEQL